MRNESMNDSSDSNYVSGQASRPTLVERIKEAPHQVWDGWTRFFFAPISLLPLGVFRFFFGLTILIMYSIRMTEWRFFYTDEGMIATQGAHELMPEFIRPFLIWYPTTPTQVLLVHGLYLVAIAFLCLGLRARIAAAVALFLHLSLVQRNFSISYGVDNISGFFFFFLILAESDRTFSLRRWLGWVKRPMSELSQMLSTVGVRFLQLQMCLIYGYTGMEKLKGPSWWDGSAVWAVLGNQQLMIFDSSWLKHIPVAIAAMTFSTLAFEVYFPILVWLKPTRKWILLFGWLLHIMIAITMGLFFFSAAMMATYFVFMNPKWIANRLTQLKIPHRLRAE